MRLNEITNISFLRATIVSGIFIVLAALALLLMGHVPICECGYIKLWHGITYSSENSQHISDWYTFSHIIHGFGFYALLWLLRKKLPMSTGFMLVLAVLAEVVWEVFENTDFVINRYREVTVSLDYYGDSVLNSVCDTLAMVLGFFMAARLPIWAIVALTIALEIFVGFYIRDNLTLNVIMLLYPFPAILEWQTGG